MFLQPSLCGGSLISLDPAWILTAAHCIKDYPNLDPSIMIDAVAYGNSNVSSLQFASIRRTIVHPKYMEKLNTTTKYDIGLVELTAPLKQTASVSRAALWPDPVLPTSAGSFSVMGMGYIGVHQPQAELLQVAKNEPRKDVNETTSSLILSKSESTLCHGDSGSPLIWEEDLIALTPPENQYVVGILNRILHAYDPDPSDQTCPIPDKNLQNVVNAFSRVSVHMEWISNTTQISPEELTTPDIFEIPKLNFVVASTGSEQHTKASTLFAFMLMTCLYWLCASA
ncbi:trypsin-like cysteine/serine peptidase domain-containing protein [Radiomyces spectabilis]|uniref:trypsin-like cysteine/serine peptidase domain-containing protein n=1 Tax=Radiomyces spectabilis TaxID=64574 RepID=UPI00221E3C6F|nr:trypsin-like cysteine/serine peptidase domain-containing protein [Radiomyces spectabilis]KAI8391255.1 trypsin-like cysteine/serine peptidase domain-containing protein [Radiomyces spectabilis]